MPRIALPAADEHAPYYGKYIEKLTVDDAYAALESQAQSTGKLLAATDEPHAMHRYAEGKWSVKEVIGHLIDAERIFAYRALRIGRGDTTDLPGFDEDAYVPEGGFDARPLTDLASEYAIVRASTLALYRGFDASDLLRRGTANKTPVSVRALAAIIAGHEKHHVGLLRERYGLTG